MRKPILFTKTSPSTVDVVVVNQKKNKANKCPKKRATVLPRSTKFKRLAKDFFEKIFLYGFITFF